MAFAFSLWRSREARNSKTYSTARRANAADAKRLHLTSGDGVILGAWNKHILRHDGDEHLLIVAPSNTGKSAGVSLPTGLVWRHFQIALNLNDGSWTVIYGLRPSFGPVYRFAPTESGAHRCNPLIMFGVATTKDPVAYGGKSMVLREPVDDAVSDRVQRMASNVTNRVVDSGLATPATIRVPAGAKLAVIVTRRSSF